MGKRIGRDGTAASPDRETLLRAVREAYEGPAWHGPSVVTALRGVPAAAAARRVAPGRNTIWDLVLHLAYTRHRAALRLARAAGQDAPPAFPRRLRASWFPEVPTDPGEASWRDDKALLAAYQQRLLEVLAGVTPDTLRARRRGANRTIGDELLGVAFHDAYHAGQIRFLAKLWEGR
jgi:hypothetical protein